MGSRNYIGHLGEDHVVTFSYCHKGSHLEDNGQTLLDHFNTEDTAKALAHTGSMSSIYDGDVDVQDNGEAAATMTLIEFIAFDAIDIESLFLYLHGNWIVKSCHIQSDKWETLQKVINEQEAAQQKKSKREALLEMMHGYQSESLTFFIGQEILDVEFICDMNREVQGVLLTLAS